MFVPPLIPLLDPLLKDLAAVLTVACTSCHSHDIVKVEDVVATYERVLDALRNSEAHLVPERLYQTRLDPSHSAGRKKAAKRS